MANKISNQESIKSNASIRNAGVKNSDDLSFREGSNRSNCDYGKAWYEFVSIMGIMNPNEVGDIIIEIIDSDYVYTEGYDFVSFVDDFKAAVLTNLIYSFCDMDDGAAQALLETAFR